MAKNRHFGYIDIILYINRSAFHVKISWRHKAWFLIFNFLLIRIQLCSVGMSGGWTLHCICTFFNCQIYIKLFWITGWDQVYLSVSLYVCIKFWAQLIKRSCILELISKIVNFWGVNGPGLRIGLPVLCLFVCCR